MTSVLSSLPVELASLSTTDALKQSVEMTVSPGWEQICAEKRAARERCIPQEWRIPPLYKAHGTNLLQIPTTCGLLTPEEIHITSDFDAVGLVEALRIGKFTAEAVTTAFCKRAAIAQQLTNCLTEILFEEAIENAKALDAERRANPTKPLAPLYGLPMSMKDSFHIAGYDSVIGLVAYVNSPATKDSDLVSLLRSLGVIFYCKTNVPQTMMTADSDNNVFGRTLNPNNINLTAGGSTGGEGALIALRGSIIGIGTDIAGSIRIPSSACGVYGFKPTSARVPFSGQQSETPDGIAGIAPSAGPLATSIRACQFILEAILRADPSQFDDSVLRIPYQGNFEALENKKLRIGVIEDDGLYTPTPPMRRALAESTKKLVAAGHEIVPVRLPDVLQNMILVWNFFSLDGCETLNQLIESTSEPLVPSVQRTGLTVTPGKTLKELFAFNYQRSLACAKFNGIWRDSNLDVMLGLPAPHTTLPFDEWLSITYTSIINLYDAPACIVPVGTVSQELDLKDDLVKYGEKDQDVYRLYSGPEEYKDAPTTLQLIGQIQEDEKLAAIAIVIDKVLNH